MGHVRSRARLTPAERSSLSWPQRVASRFSDSAGRGQSCPMTIYRGIVVYAHQFISAAALFIYRGLDLWHRSSDYGKGSCFPDMCLGWPGVCAAPVGVLPAGGLRPGGDMLASWAEALGRDRAGVGGRACLRFAFYGRVSTEDWQDPVTSRTRQLQQAVMLVAGARRYRGGVLRHGTEPGPAMGAAPAGRRAGRAARGPGPRVGRDRDRGVRAGVLREPVRFDGAAVRALRHTALDAGSRLAGRLARRGPRADDARAGIVVQAGDHPDADPGPDRDGRPD
jgi:hypothetical protein